MQDSELLVEVDRLKAEFAAAGDDKIRKLEGLFEQAAFERIYLRRLNEKAVISGLVEFHPENALKQRSLPVSGEIARHAAALTNIMDKLMKHCDIDFDPDDEGLDGYE